MIKPEKIPENSEKTPKIFQKTLNFREKSPKKTLKICRLTSLAG